MSDIQREGSFRSAIKNQKRRLSATKLPSKDKLIVDGNHQCVTGLILGRRESRDSSGGSLANSRKNSLVKSDSLPEDENVPDPPPSPIPEKKEEVTKRQNSFASRESTPEIVLDSSPLPAHHSLPRPATPSSPYTPHRPSPLTITNNNTLPRPKSKSPCPGATRGRSPVPPDSPLLCKSPKTPTSPTAKRAREFNRELRRARSFRRSMERSCSRTRLNSESESENRTPDRETTLDEEASFAIRKHLGGRTGWKIMPENTSGGFKGEALKRVVGMIKEMELKGHAIPERITIKV